MCGTKTFSDFLKVKSALFGKLRIVLFMLKILPEFIMQKLQEIEVTN